MRINDPRFVWAINMLSDKGDGKLLKWQKNHDMRAEIECIYGDEFPGMMFMDGLDSAIIGVALVNSNPLVTYSTEKILDNLVDRGMGFDEAREFMMFNILGAYMGEFTPLVIDDLF